MTKNLISTKGFMMKQDLAEAVRDSLGGKINLWDANVIVTAMFKAIRKGLIGGKRVNIMNVGVLYPSVKKEYTIKRADGEKMTIPASRTIRFRQSKTIRTDLKNSDYEL